MITPILFRDIVGLRDIQRDLAGLVDHQGEDIDRIGQFVIVSKDVCLSSLTPSYLAFPFTHTHTYIHIHTCLPLTDKHVAQAEVRVSEGLRQTDNVSRERESEIDR